LIIASNPALEQLSPLAAALSFPLGRAVAPIAKKGIRDLIIFLVKFPLLKVRILKFECAPF
jgi:hypothetical protein